MSLSFFFLICKTLFFNHDIYKIVKPCLVPIIIVKLGITWQVNKEFKQPMTLTKFYMLINQSCNWHGHASVTGQVNMELEWLDKTRVKSYFFFFSYKECSFWIRDKSLIHKTEQPHLFGEEKKFPIPKSLIPIFPSFSWSTRNRLHDANLITTWSRNP